MLRDFGTVADWELARGLARCQSTEGLVWFGAACVFLLCVVLVLVLVLWCAVVCFAVQVAVDDEESTAWKCVEWCGRWVGRSDMFRAWEVMLRWE